jgi:hypothetical protein
LSKTNAAAGWDKFSVFRLKDPVQIASPAGNFMQIAVQTYFSSHPNMIPRVAHV